MDAESSLWKRQRVGVVGLIAAALVIAVIGCFLPIVPLTAELPGPEVYRGAGISAVERFPDPCEDIPNLSVTVPKRISPGSSVVVTVTVGIGIDHLEGEYDYVELFISESPDDCDRYPGHFLENVPTWLPSFNYNSTSTFQRTFNFETGLAGGQTFYVNGNYEAGQIPALTSGNVVAVYYPS